MPDMNTLQLVRFAEASASIIILYDYVLTFNEELQYIWRARWGTGKTLFLVSRYYNIFAVILNKTLLNFTQLPAKVLCLGWVIWQSANAVFVYVVTTLIMILRLYAMFERSKKVLYSCLALIVLVLAAEGVIMYFAIRSALGVSDLLTFMHVAEIPTQYCAALNGWKLSYLFWIPLIISEIVLFSLSLYKGYQCYFKDNGDKWGGYSGIRCMDVLIKDSILYFFAVFAVYVTCVIFWVVPSHGLQAMPIDFHPALSMVITQRLILNIRSHCKKNSGIVSDAEDVGTWFGGDRPDLADVETGFLGDSVYELALHGVGELSRFGEDGSPLDSENGRVDRPWDEGNEK